MRALAWFWAGILVLVAGGAGTLQWLGPPAATSQLAPVLALEAAPPAGGLAIGGPVPPPDPALLEPSRDFPGSFLPRIGADRRTPAQAYAAGADPAETRPVIGILLAGIGMSVADSDQAIIATPPAVSLAVSPYTVQPDALLAEARQHGHEYFLSVPMEPRDYPLNDPGNRALLTGSTAAANDRQLAWALGRFGGYVGATGALGALHGERFADSASQFGPFLDAVGRRGLLYVDPRPGAAPPPGVAARAIDLVVDRSPAAAEIDANLARLEQLARARGSALGLVSVPRPVAVARLVAWTAALKERGFALQPVSAVIRTPPRAQQAGTP